MRRQRPPSLNEVTVTAILAVVLLGLLGAALLFGAVDWLAHRLIDPLRPR